jgi:hypothetical protein
MKPNKANQSSLMYVIQAKASYRADAQAKSWEEKIESIARMRRMTAEQKLGVVSSGIHQG